MITDFELMKVSNNETSSEKTKPEMYNYYFGGGKGGNNLGQSQSDNYNSLSKKYPELGDKGFKGDRELTDDQNPNMKMNLNNSGMNRQNYPDQLGQGETYNQYFQPTNYYQNNYYKIVNQNPYQQKIEKNFESEEQGLSLGNNKGFPEHKFEHKFVPKSMKVNINVKPKPTNMNNQYENEEVDVDQYGINMNMKKMGINDNTLGYNPNNPNINVNPNIGLNTGIPNTVTSTGSSIPNVNPNQSNLSNYYGSNNDNYQYNNNNLSSNSKEFIPKKISTLSILFLFKIYLFIYLYLIF